MCDIAEIPCEHCGRKLPVHIGDYCTPASNIMVRCGVHPPKSDSVSQWAKFSDIYDGIEFDFEPHDWGTWYIGLRNPALVDPGYGFNGRGICPDTDGWELEEVAAL